MSQSEVEQIINNVTKSSSGIFHLLQVPKVAIESTEHENGSLGINLVLNSTPTNSSKHHRVKKQKSKRERNARRSEFQKRMIATGDYRGLHTYSSSSSEESSQSDTIVFEEYRKRLFSMDSTNEGILEKLYVPSIQKYSAFSHNYSGSSNVESEGFQGFQIRSEYNQARLLTPLDKSAKKMKFSVTRHAGSLSDNYLTSASQTYELAEKEPHTSSSSSERNQYLNSAIKNNSKEKVTKVEEKGIECDDDPGAVDDKRFSVLEANGTQIKADSSSSLEDKWLKYSEELNKTTVEKEILKNYVIKSNTGFKSFHRCMACNDRFLLDTGLEDHLKRTTIDIDFNCQYCHTNLKFFNRCNLLYHLKEHEIEPTVDYLQQFTVRRPVKGPEYLVFEYGSLSEDEEDITSPDSQIRPLDSICLSPAKQESETLEIICEESVSELLLVPVEVVAKPNARSDDGVHRCLKCVSYSTNNEEEFYSHVKSIHTWSKEEMQQLFHKNGDRSEFWCPECNDTFVTKLALTMHLKVAHEFLKDISVYMEKLGYEGKIPLLDNQCEVCYLMFEDPFELRKHMRNHGLAYLRLQKRQRLQDAKAK